ncbi:MAG TPA: TonB-dependent receptor [Polyangia bacterium]|nr:TonB-dependent receptor [Polyangia bacterium]
MTPRRYVAVAAVVVALRAFARADEPTGGPVAGAPATPVTPHAPPFQTVVTGPTPVPNTPREDRAAAVSVVLPSDSPRAYDDLASLLLQVPGVTVARTGASQAFTSITLRGSNPDQVSIYIDGVPLNIAEGGGVDVATLPLGDVERVEVYRGTTPLAFGESALGGIISITTRTPGLTRATLRAGVGSFGTRFADATGGKRLGRLRLYLGAHVFSSDGDYPLNYNLTNFDLANAIDAVRQNNDTLEGNGVLRAGLTLTGRRTLTLGLIGFARAQGLPGPTNNLALHARFHTVRGLGTLRYDSRDDLGPGGRLSAEAFVSVERDRLLDPDGEIENRGPLAVHETTVSTGGRMHAARPFGGWGRAAIVLEGRRETYTPENEINAAAAGIPAHRLVGVAGSELALHVRRLDLEIVPSARVEGMRDVVTGQNGAGQFLPAGPAIDRALPTYRLALVRPLSASATMKANVGRYAHAPSFLEFYGDGTQRLLGNPGLVPEEGTNADLALWIDRAGPHVAIASRTTLFGALADDLIYWVPSVAGPSRAENLNAARIYGLEEELQLALGRHGRLVAQATTLVADDESDSPTTRGKQIPHHPPVSAYARPELVHVALPRGLELAAYADAALIAGAYADPANVRRVPAQVLLGAGAALIWPRAGLRLTASALNLTSLASWDFNYWPLPGRTLFLALAYDPTGAAAIDAPGPQPFGNR